MNDHWLVSFIFHRLTIPTSDSRRSGWIVFLFIRVPTIESHTCDSSLSWLFLPLSAVGVAGMAFVIGLCVLEDETVGALQAIGTLFNTVGTILEMDAPHTSLWALWKITKKRHSFFSDWHFHSENAVLNTMYLCAQPSVRCFYLTEIMIVLLLPS